MPFIIAGLSALILDLGIDFGTAAVAPTGAVTPEDAGLYPLDIHGLLLPFGVPSEHAIWRRKDGSEFMGGALTFCEEGMPPDFLDSLAGLPLLGGDKRTRIGVITRAWVEGGAVRIAGRVKDTQRIRYHLTRDGYGLCVGFAFPENYAPMTEVGQMPPVTPKRVYVTLPGCAAFPQTFVTFTDRAVRWRPEDVLGMAPPMDWEW